MAVGAEPRTGIEDLLFAVDVDEGYDVIELGEAKEAFGEDGVLSAGYQRDISLETHSTGHRNEEFGDLVV
jgi:hypothetical protein